MSNFWYIDELSGEEFIVQAKTMVEAVDIMHENGFNVRHVTFLGTVTYEAAETMGVDIY
jgi:hypothetical protein